MTVQIEAKTDLEAVLPIENMEWQSVGFDPSFTIHFSMVRSPIVAIRLWSEEKHLDPKVYIDRGHGYRESDAVSLGHHENFLMVLDVGVFGNIRMFRLDPSTCPVRFKMSVEVFSSRAEAQSSQFFSMNPSLKEISYHDLGQIPRFTWRWTSLSFRKSASDVQRYLDAQYRSASTLAIKDNIPQHGIWLSVIVPVYNAPRHYLEELVQSFKSQQDTGVELILTDDASTNLETRQWIESFKPSPGISFVRGRENKGIAGATNAGLAIASGKWITFLDHDDVIAPHAFKVLRKAIQENFDAYFFYTDEVVVDEDLKPLGIMLKPAFDPVLLSGVNYINHFSIFRHDRLKEIGGLRTGFDGSQDYDLLLRYLADTPESQIFHVPYPAYWWRRGRKSYSVLFIDKATRAARSALTDYFSEKGRQVSVEPALTSTLHRVLFLTEDAKNPVQKVSVIIPSRDSLELIQQILADVFLKTDYPNLEVIVVDNGTSDDRVLNLYSEYKKLYSNFSVLHREESEFNFARSVNLGISAASGDFFLLLNNDVEVRDPDWLKEMVSCMNFDNVGIVGAKLLYGNNSLQHAGVIVGFGGLAGHWFLNHPSDYAGPMNRLHVRNSMTCVTGAVMLISRACAQRIGPWDEHNFAVAYNDVDFCLRAHRLGFRTVWTPFACLFHHESVTRGSDTSGPRKKRFEREKLNLLRVHSTDTFEDPAVHPGYEKDKSSPGLRIPQNEFLPRTWFQPK